MPNPLGTFKFNTDYADLPEELRTAMRAHVDALAAVEAAQDNVLKIAGRHKLSNLVSRSYEVTYSVTAQIQLPYDPDQPDLPDLSVDDIRNLGEEVLDEEITDFHHVPDDDEYDACYEDDDEE